MTSQSTDSQSPPEPDSHAVSGFDASSSDRTSAAPLHAQIDTPRQSAIAGLRNWLRARIIGQETLVDRLIISLLVGGHLLVEGPPGLAKTRAIKELARGVEGEFHRIQFTPDLMPSDVTGSEVYRANNGTFEFQHGPIFNNLVLADEINRAPAKVQSALLEAMAEHQVSIGRRSFTLPPLFMVMATQNPIEQEGTYPLPEAQLDRFLLHVMVGYPDTEAETNILRLVRSESGDDDAPPPAVVDQTSIMAIRKELVEMHMEPAVESYIVALTMATRKPERYDESLARAIEFGCSPRATIALDQCARANAWLEGRDYVTPLDVQAIAADVLRHRIIVSYEAQAQGIDANAVISQIMACVPSP